MNKSSPSKKRLVFKTLKYAAVIILIALAIYCLQVYGIAQLRESIKGIGPWAIIAIFLLRFTSVVIPALPGTVYSVIAGTVFGFSQGLLIICLADLASCSTSFFLSRQYGKRLVRHLVGDRFMSRVERIGKRHLENNFFLMIGCLMTGFFDFVCYGIGLTKTPWLKFFPALVLSIGLSNTPVVALSAGILDPQHKWWILILSILGIFILAIITGLTRKQIDLN